MIFCMSAGRRIKPLFLQMAVVQCVGAYISGVRGFIGGDIQNLDTLIDRVGHGVSWHCFVGCTIQHTHFGRVF